MRLAPLLLAGCIDGGDPDPDESGTVRSGREENLASAAGDFAYDLLRDDTYTRLVIEVDWVRGHAPDPAALDAVADAIDALCHKPGGVTVLLDDEIPDQGGPTWTYRSAESLEIAWRDQYRDASAGVAVLYFLYLDGRSDADSGSARVLGYAYHGSSAVMFEETIASTGTGLPLLGGSVEEAVIVHELGHLLGLVNNGVPMVTPHQDTAHGAHDHDDRCLMYWAVETDLVAGLLGGGVPELDAACRADLAAAGGKP